VRVGLDFDLWVDRLLAQVGRPEIAVAARLMSIVARDRRAGAARDESAVTVISWQRQSSLLA
jgi:hypothetical protein